MAIVNCTACGKVVSTEATSCPHCGQVIQSPGMSCKFCGSSKVTLAAQGFSAKKAITGALLFGPLGALAGGLGAKKEQYSCASCGKSWVDK